MMHCEEFRAQACAAGVAQESHLPCATREPKPTIVNDPSLLRRCALEVKSLRLAADMAGISAAHKYTDFRSRFDYLEHANTGQSVCAAHDATGSMSMSVFQPGCRTADSANTAVRSQRVQLQRARAYVCIYTHTHTYIYVIYRY